MTIDDLGEYGMARMTDEEIRGFLSSQRVGVLALSSEGAPSMRPLSFHYDGGDRLYLLFVVGSGSRKEDLSRQSESARFLVYSAETAFNWRSVLLAGAIDEVPASEQETVERDIEGAWRPDLFESARASEETRLYQFAIEERTGVEHLGLPPDMDAEPTGDDSG